VTRDDCAAIEAKRCVQVHALQGIRGGAAEIDRLATEAPARSCAQHVDLMSYYTELPGALPSGAACYYAPQCASGMCEREGDECGQCAAVEDAASQRCKGNNGVHWCSGGLICDADFSGCVALPGLGEPCIHGGCARGLACGKDSRCEPWNFLGEDCDPAGSACYGLACDAATRKCAPPELNPDGSPCGGWPQSAGPCRSGSTCHGSLGDGPGTCRPYSRLDAPCGWSCPLTTQCIDGTCQVAPLLYGCP